MCLCRHPVFHLTGILEHARAEDIKDQARRRPDKRGLPLWVPLAPFHASLIWN